MTAIRNYLNKKGQGIVEYAVLLAFVVGLAASLQGVGIKDAVIGVFDDVATLLGGGAKSAYAIALEKWGKISKSDLLSDDTKDERLQIDQESLANIGRFFIGRDKDFVDKYLLTQYPSDACLFHYGETTDADGNVSSYIYYDKNNSETRSAQNDEIARTADVIHWMQGDFGTYDAATNSIVEDSYKTEAFNSGTRYMFSDYPVQKNTEQAGNGVKLTLKYTDGVVSEATVKVNPKQGDKTKDLSVTVDKDKNYTLTN